MARRNKRKNGGSGTRVGNFLRSTFGNIGSPFNQSFLGANALFSRRPQNPNLVQTNPYQSGNDSYQDYSERARAEALSKPYLKPTVPSRLGIGNPREITPSPTPIATQGNEQLGPYYSPGGSEGFDEFGRDLPGNGIETENVPQVSRISGGDKYYSDPYVAGSQSYRPSPGVSTEEPVPEFLRSGVSTQKNLSGILGGGSDPSGGGFGGRSTTIPGTAIEDPVYANLIKQLEKDSQLDINVDEIRRKSERQAQSEIDAINAVYKDLIGRAERTGNENIGSERAIQARSGNLGSNFGENAIKKDVAERDSNIGEIKNQNTLALQDVYKESRNRADQEFGRLTELRNSGVEGYLQAIEQERSMLDEGLDNFAEYVALRGLSGDQLDRPALERIAQDWKTTPEAVYTRIMNKSSEIQRRGLDMEEQRANITGTRDSGAVDFDQRSDELIALSVLPTQLKNSEREMEYYLGAIKAGLSKGLSPYQVADNLMGYKVNEENAFTSNMRQLIGQSALQPAKIADIARFINDGQYERAVSLVENNILSEAKKAGDDFISEATVSTAVSRANDLFDVVESNPKYADKIGNFSGTMQKALGKLRGKEATYIKNQVTRLVAEMRNKLLGSAVTPSEERFLEPLIPDLNDKTDVFFEKLSRLSSEPLLEYNSIRNQYGLVPLDETTLFDKGKRVESYFGFNLGGGSQYQTQGVSGGEMGAFSW